MKRKLIYICIINWFCFVGLQAQTASRTTTTGSADSRTTATTLPEKPKAPAYQQWYGLRVGADLSKLIEPFFNSNYYGLELVDDYRLSSAYYAAAGIGLERKRTNEDFFAYTTEGQFLRAGFDYNSYGNWYGMENQIYVGTRYGFLLFSQDLNSHITHKDNQYFTENTAGSSTGWLKKHSGRTAHWFEIVLDIKAELLYNLYAGASVRVGVLALQTGSKGFPNYYIPAFGRIYENSHFGASFNYTLTYLIPFYKGAKKPVTTND